MAELLVVLIFAATSTVAWALNVTILRLGVPRLGALGADVLECLGFGVIFLTANVGVGMLTVFLLRGVTSWFVTLYVFVDVILVPVSFVQGVALFCWRRQSGTSHEVPVVRL